MNRPLKLLAIDCSTETLSLALGPGGAEPALARFEGPGAAQASATLLPALQALLAQAGWTLQALDALVFGRGPGSFTGLRTACAVAQGLAYGSRSERHPAGLPVLPVDSLLAVAQAALLQGPACCPAPGRPVLLAALLDARMGELYVALYRWTDAGLGQQALCAPQLCAPGQLGAWLRLHWPLPEPPTEANCLLAGPVFDVYQSALAGVPGERLAARPSAQALLELAPALLAQHRAVNASDALPLYVRDRVALTSAEREQRSQVAR